MDLFLFKYNELEDRASKTIDAEQDKKALEEIVLNLRGQLADLERIQLERQQLENKLKAVEDELKATVCVQIIIATKDSFDLYQNVLLNLGLTNMEKN